MAAAENSKNYIEAFLTCSTAHNDNAGNCINLNNNPLSIMYCSAPGLCRPLCLECKTCNKSFIFV